MWTRSHGKRLKKKKRLKIKDSKIGKGMSRNTSFYLIIVAKINYMSLAFCKISNYKYRMISSNLGSIAFLLNN